MTLCIPNPSPLPRDLRERTAQAINALKSYANPDTGWTPVNSVRVLTPIGWIRFFTASVGPIEVAYCSDPEEAAGLTVRVLRGFYLFRPEQYIGVNITINSHNSYSLYGTAE